MTRSRHAGLWALAALLGGCTAGTDTGNPAEDGDFVVDSPVGEIGGGDQPGGGPTDGEDDGGPNGQPPPGRLIEEADLIQLDGDLLYALVPGTGLHVIDLADPEDLTRVGGHAVGGRAFEMLLDGDLAFVVTNDYGRYVEDDGRRVYRTSARVVVLDIEDPAAILERESFTVPGEITEARRVGDILYVVSVERDFCWRCEPNPNTTITALDLRDPDAITVADQLRFTSDDERQDYSYRRPVSLNDQRMYVGSDSWAPREDARSTIQVIDISDPDGQLLEGATIDVAGAISSRWQMDEHEGVLRVVSQAPSAGEPVPPVVQTFAVRSANDIEPLGSLTLRLPRPERLRSVRFDGLRGFAVTSEQTDPLFTLDLSEPAAPVQRGELEIPGFLHHMEPRGDRLIALGFEAGNPMGALHVSLFDVSDLDNPTMLSRVHFGGDAGNFAEGQDRLHRALGIFEEQGLLTVPFTGWTREENLFAECPGTRQDGVQLVDLAPDSLALRGAADVLGTPRRAFLRDGSLLSVSNEAAQRFDLSDRDDPAELSRLRLARSVARLAVAGEFVVRLSKNERTQQRDLFDVVPLSEVGRADSLGQLDLSPLRPDNPKFDEGQGAPACYFEWAEEFAGLWPLDGDVYMASFAYNDLILSVVDIREPTAPRFVDSFEFPIRRSHSELFLTGLGGGTALVDTGALVVVSAEQEWSGDRRVRNRPVLSVIDLSDRERPELSERFLLPDSLAHGDVMVAGDRVLLPRMEAVPGDASKVRILLERLDVSDPAAPEQLPSLSLPGQPLRYDEEAERVVTLDLHVGEVLDDEACGQEPATLHRDDRCHALAFGVSLLALGEDQARRIAETRLPGLVTAVAASDERLFVATTQDPPRFYLGDGLVGGSEPDPIRSQLRIYDLTNDDLEQSASEDLLGYYGFLHARGRKAVGRVEAGVLVVDAGDPAAPELTLHDTLAGRYCYLAAVEQDYALCIGSQTVQRIDF